MAKHQVNASELPKVVKAPALSIHYKNANGEATLHATGCAHASRADEVSDGYTAGQFLADDWFYVAPCAKKAVK